MLLAAARAVQLLAAEMTQQLLAAVRMMQLLAVEIEARPKQLGAAARTTAGPQRRRSET